MSSTGGDKGPDETAGGSTPNTAHVMRWCRRALTGRRVRPDSRRLLRTFRKGSAKCRTIDNRPVASANQTQQMQVGLKARVRNYERPKENTAVYCGKAAIREIDTMVGNADYPDVCPIAFSTVVAHCRHSPENILPHRGPKCGPSSILQRCRKLVGRSADGVPRGIIHNSPAFQRY